MLTKYAKSAHKRMDASSWHIFLTEFSSLGVCIKAINLFIITYDILGAIPEKRTSKKKNRQTNPNNLTVM